LKISSNVTLIDRIPNEQVPIYLNFSEVFAIPFSPLFNFGGEVAGVGDTIGIAQLEAMAAGLPVVGTAIGDLKKLEAELNNALVYVPPNNPKSLADAIVYLLDPRSPYRDFLCDFCSQLIGRGDYDGIFLDTLALKPDSLRDERNLREYNEGGYQSWQEFRYATVHEFAKSVYDAVKDANSDALLVINNNNIFYQTNDTGVPLRDYYALSIERLDDVADVFLLELCGIDSVEPEVIAAVVDRERAEYGVKSDLWVLYYTLDEKRFEDAKKIAVSKEVGLWNYPSIFLF
jgi:hypothetical protein